MKRLAALVLALLPACASTGDYLHDRGADLVDVVRGHVMVGKAIGVNVHATQWLGLGFMYEEDVWAAGLHNRALGTWDENIQGWGLLVHDWTERTKGIPAYSGSYGWYQKPGGPGFHGTGSYLDVWTLRASLAVLLGLDLELRLGELVDFVGGIVTWDPAHDDGGSAG